MWKRFVENLRCPLCRGRLMLHSFTGSRQTLSAEHIALGKQLKVFDKDFNAYVEAGLLLCDRCKSRFPIENGLPIMFGYTTPAHTDFAKKFASQIRECAGQYDFPSGQPQEGELFTMLSFSEEWRSYSYDGVLWRNTYEDLEATFALEVDFTPGRDRHASFLEIGCGLGLTTALAQRFYKGDAVGVDLSFACMRAAQQFKDNPFVHFVQASAFHLPFEERSFGVVYSRGVLHHTYSTRDSFKEVATFCRPTGLVYVWVYGPGSIHDSPARKAAYLAEVAIRPVLSRSPSSLGTTMFLSFLTAPYRLANWFHRLQNPKIQKYTYRRAMHAARDRFTPKYAHRHQADEVCNWFQDAGFEEVTVVNWRSMPVAQQDTYRRNIGVHGRQKAAVRILEFAAQ